MLRHQRIVFATLSVLVIGAPMTSRDTFAEDLSRAAAGGACMEFIKRRLHDPGSASFAHSDESTVMLKGPRAVVIRPVRAKNAYGATVAQQFMCFLELSGGQIRPVLITAQGENTDLARSLFKRWKMP